MEYVFTIQRAIHTIKGDNASLSENAAFSELCPFFDLRLFILYKASHSRALIPTCGALVFKNQKQFFGKELAGDIHYLIALVQRSYQNYFSYIAAASAPIRAFLELTCHKSCIWHYILSKPRVAFLHKHHEIDGEKGLNPVALTIINPWKAMD